MQPSRPPPERAQGYVLGPLPAALQLEGTFDPAGPWLATTDEIDGVLALGMWLDVNGVRRQTGNTKTMIFDPYFIVHYLSQFLVLEPGDLINTGTPPGVGMGLTRWCGCGQVT